LLASVFALPGGVPETVQLWPLSRLWAVGRCGFDDVRFDLWWIRQTSHVQLDQHVGLRPGHFCLARLLALAQCCARRRRQPLADRAMGAGLGGYSTSGLFRFSNPDV